MRRCSEGSLRVRGSIRGTEKPTQSAPAAQCIQCKRLTPNTSPCHWPPPAPPTGPCHQPLSPAPTHTPHRPLPAPCHPASLLRRHLADSCALGDCSELRLDTCGCDTFQGAKQTPGVQPAGGRALVLKGSCLGSQWPHWAQRTIVQLSRAPGTLILKAGA